MEHYVFFIGITLVLAGAAALIASLVFARQLIALLSAGPLQSTCRILAVLIGFLVFSYLGFLPVAWKNKSELIELGVPVVFFVFGCFVLIVSILASKTASSVRRVAFLEQENITDALTGLYNRRYLDQRVREETSKAERYRLPLSILMIDIDHFKSINDTYGHQVGDIVLSGVAKVVTGIARNTDIVARYGGKKFWSWPRIALLRQQQRLPREFVRL
jgi:predicted signal transduction protein with EAL and GGDEF domain